MNQIGCELFKNFFNLKLNYLKSSFTGYKSDIYFYSDILKDLFFEAG